MLTEILTGGITSFENGLRVILIRSNTVPAPETFISEREIEKFSSIKIEKRRRDWLGGRYAAKILLRESGTQTPLRDIAISYDRFGRPVAGSGGATRLISITHSGPFCAAACAREDANFLGIDLEKTEPRHEAWYKDYFHAAELAPAAAISHTPDAISQNKETPEKAYGLWHTASTGGNMLPVDLATRIWTQKEALLKALGLGLKADPLDINLTGGSPEFSRAALERYKELGRPPFTLRTFETIPDYLFSLVWQRTAGK
jgi:4'-phosphopantetheinyl transferase